MLRLGEYYGYRLPATRRTRASEHKKGNFPSRSADYFANVDRTSAGDTRISRLLLLGQRQHSRGLVAAAMQPSNWWLEWNDNLKKRRDHAYGCS
jgi:hypothetical protein